MLLKSVAKIAFFIFSIIFIGKLLAPQLEIWSLNEVSEITDESEQEDDAENEEDEIDWQISMNLQRSTFDYFENENCKEQLEHCSMHPTSGELDIFSPPPEL